MKQIRIGDFGVLNAINNGIINSAILISGSSRGYVQYSPTIIAQEIGLSCFNISFNASDLGLQVAILRWYLAKNKPPRYLIQNIDIFNSDISPSVYEPFKFIPYLDNRELYHGLLQINRRWCFHKYIPISNLINFGKNFQSKMAQVMFRLILGKGDYLIQGYFPRYNQWISEEYERKFMLENAAGKCYSISPTYIKYIKELVKICQEHEIQLILVISPEYKKFIELQLNRNDIIKFYLCLSNENNLWLYDYSDSYICSQKKYFYNFTHMNAD